MPAEAAREIEVYPGANGKYYYRVNAKMGGKTVLDGSQGYADKDGALFAARREFKDQAGYVLVYTNAAGAIIYEPMVPADGQG